MYESAYISNRTLKMEKYFLFWSKMEKKWNQKIRIKLQFRRGRKTRQIASFIKLKTAQQYILERFCYGTPDAIRTHDLQSRSLTLYPAELQAQIMVTHRGFEPLLPPWEGGVLTAWPMGRICCKNLKNHSCNSRYSTINLQACQYKMQIPWKFRWGIVYFSNLWYTSIILFTSGEKRKELDWMTVVYEVAVS